ncbi:TetR/AcrR family transcriptional regulator [Agromyces ramosus]|uniref:AcrR family transcriptional regulator n=1 Tax=Agromyces ramosus TaxID=33879 RepID=A0ABU0RC71_9MICO|nr:TetR-like C-terminal domain-containing protein [Agromyces ramosus]MDQ0895680.1 AcrR family transcriptional regulator [Agromyces ramosus]
MPTPDRTSLDEIVAAGRSLLESGGLSGLTMQAVADRVGVRAPSLYKRVRDRSELVARVAEATIRELGDRLDAAAAGEPDPRRALAALARAVRSFARGRPVAFGVVFSPGADLDLDPESLARASATVIRIAAELAGEERALDAARTVTAWLNGFVGMELSGAFRLGGDVDRAFEFGIVTLTEALTRRG